MYVRCICVAQEATGTREARILSTDAGYRVSLGIECVASNLKPRLYVLGGDISRSPRDESRDLKNVYAHVKFSSAFIYCRKPEHPVLRKIEK